MTRMGDLRRSKSGIPTAALAGDQRGAAVAPTEKTRLSAIRGETARGEPVTLPALGDAYIQLISHTASNRVEAAVLKSMEAEGIPMTAGFSWSVDVDRKARTLAIAVRDPEDHGKPFGSTQEWLEEDDSIIVAAYLVYEDVLNRLDPLGSPSLTEERAKTIAEAFKKKDRMLLLYFGVAELSAWLLSGAVQLTSSPTPSSSSTESSPDSLETSSQSSQRSEEEA